MRTPLTLLSFTALIALGGCAGTLNQLVDRPITSDHLDEPGELSKLKTLSGDRRLVRVVADGVRPELDIAGRPTGRAATDSDGNILYLYDVCAETQADAIVARGATSAFTVEGQAGLTDTATQSLTLTNTRGSVSDVVRQLAWQICSARMNGYLDEREYADQLINLTYNAMAVLQQTAMGASSKAVQLRGAPDIQSPQAPAAEPAASSQVAPGLPVTTTTTTTTKVGG